MRISTAAGLLVQACCVLPVLCLAQGHANETLIPAKSAVSPAAPAAVPAVPSPAQLAPAPFSTTPILGPSLDTVKQTLDSVRVDKWKRGTVRDEAAGDINSIQREMQENLPPLMKEADATQGALSKVLPVSAHVDALYDVLLRVLEAARISAPDDQATSIRLALNALGSARLALDKQALARANAQEKQVADLHAAVEKQAAFKCPAPPPTPVCAKPAVKKPAKKAPAKPAAKPDSAATPDAKKPASTTTAPKPQ